MSIVDHYPHEKINYECVSLAFSATSLVIDEEVYIIRNDSRDCISRE